MSKRSFHVFNLIFIMLACHVCAAQDVPVNPQQVRPLLPGMLAPSLKLRLADGESYVRDTGNLAKPIVLVFYRGGWCPYCNLHLAALRSAEKTLLEMGYEVLFVSPDKPEVLYPSLQEKDISYVLLSDSEMTAARAFGVAYRLDDATVERYKSNGVDLEAAAGQAHGMLPVPAVFIVGLDGVIDFQYVNPNYKVRLHPDVLVTAARVGLEAE